MTTKYHLINRAIIEKIKRLEGVLGERAGMSTRLAMCSKQVCDKDMGRYADEEMFEGPYQHTIVTGLRKIADHLETHMEAAIVGQDGPPEGEARYLLALPALALADYAEWLADGYSTAVVHAANDLALETLTDHPVVGERNISLMNQGTAFLIAAMVSGGHKNVSEVGKERVKRFIVDMNNDMDPPLPGDEVANIVNAICRIGGIHD